MQNLLCKLVKLVKLKQLLGQSTVAFLTEQLATHFQFLGGGVVLTLRISHFIFAQFSVWMHLGALMPSKY